VTFGVLEYTVYFANMSSPSYQVSGPTWEKYYSVKDTYGRLLVPSYTSPTAELVPALWHNLTEVFETNDSAFQQYYARKQCGYDPALRTGGCRTEEICGMR
jgi:sphingomyelin phosphodiesterase